MPAYMFSGVTILDQSKMGGYQADVVGIVRGRGGRFLVRGGTVEHLEGEYRPTRLVIVEFDSMDAARDCYHSPEYQTIKPGRAGAAEVSVLIVDGWDGTGTTNPPSLAEPPGAYAFTGVTVLDPERMQQFRRNLVPIIEGLDGRILARGSTIEYLEGPYRPEHVALIAFPTSAHVHDYIGSDAYQEIMPLRKGAAEVDLVVGPALEQQPA